jgi:hypothetical protein
MKKFSLFVLLIVTGLNTYAQSVYVNNGTWATKTKTIKGKNGDVECSYHGSFNNNVFTNIYAIEVSYKDSIKGNAVLIHYSIVIKDDNKYFQTDKELEAFKLTDNTAKLKVVGLATKFNEGNNDTIANFSDIVYSIGDKRFKGWIVAKNSKTESSVTSGIIKTGLYSSSADMKFTGQKVTFFRIENDFSLKLDAKPTTLGQQVNQAVAKPTVK